MSNKNSETQEILAAIADVHKAVTKSEKEIHAHVEEVLNAIGEFSNKTEERFQGLEGDTHRLKTGQGKIITLLDKDAKKTADHEAESAANKAAHDRFEKRLKKLEKKQAA